MSRSCPGGKVIWGRGNSVYEKLWHHERTWPFEEHAGLHAVHVHLVMLVLGDNGNQQDLYDKL